ncbi:hypothetical protein HUG10_01935 [Halorarum halophilum]|uniref:Uncharacterized protein n=1 Tax=Halorarum halophilum TaxID=2743090 RepID=A0A7D5KDS6_9EURY|nr:DUF5791 family protein [Halobaculum halophilum]QLG26376.1 hypothetical protein HUG10_01935 [Halobaculum halophilum]
MLYDAHGDPEGATPDELLAAYAEELSAVVADHGVDSTVEETGLDPGTVESIAAGDVADVRLAEAVSVLALTEDAPPEDLAYEVRDHLMMEMVTAILDVDTIAANIEPDLTGQEVQQALEGRTRLTLGELAAIHALVLERQQ